MRWAGPTVHTPRPLVQGGPELGRWHHGPGQGAGGLGHQAVHRQEEEGGPEGPLPRYSQNSPYPIRRVTHAVLLQSGFLSMYRIMPR